MTAAAKTKWHLTGRSIGSCNCAWGCPCQFSALPTHGQCDGFGTYKITTGHFGEVTLDGVCFALSVYWPGPVSEGNGTRQVFIDESASEEQREAIVALWSLKHGGAFFEIYGSVTPNVLETIYAPIEFVLDRAGRRASVRIAGFLESTIEPITTVTGAEQVAKIVLPNGFEWKEADMANSVKWSAKQGDVRTLGSENTYAELADFDWSND
jgi:hypothetical protein